MNSNNTHITLLLDASGSIGAILDDAIAGCNRFVSDQKQLDNGNATLSLVLFNDNRQVVYSRTPLAQVPPLNRQNYPTTGGTALLDALGATLVETTAQIDALSERERPRNVVFVVFTDGLENASRRFSRQHVFDLIRQRQETSGWQFLFLGAGQDAIREGGRIGIRPDAALTFQADGTGTLSAFTSASAAVSTFRSSAGDQPVTFSDNDRKAQERLERERRKQRPSKN